MKIIEFVKKYQIILFLSFLVIVLLVLQIVYKTKNQEEISIPTPTPTPTIIKPKEIDGISYEVLNDVNPNYPLKKLLPYSTDNFSILGYDDPFTLIVRNISGDEVTNEKEIRQWIEKYIPGDKEHKIVFLK